jgi:hypothetical protein
MSTVGVQVSDQSVDKVMTIVGKRVVLAIPLPIISDLFLYITQKTFARAFTSRRSSD